MTWVDLPKNQMGGLRHGKFTQLSFYTSQDDFETLEGYQRCLAEIVTFAIEGYINDKRGVPLPRMEGPKVAGSTPENQLFQKLFLTLDSQVIDLTYTATHTQGEPMRVDSANINIYSMSESPEPLDNLAASLDRRIQKVYEQSKHRKK
jgi:hypothetical protein